MKQIISGISVLSLVFFLASCGSGVKGDKVETGNAQVEQLVVGEKSLKADLAASNVEWVGSKPGGQHNGTVSLKEGSVELSEGKLVGGSFVLDMSSIKVLDISDAKMNGDLRGHLLSNDFFAVDSFPTASFVITGVEPKQAEGVNHRITGNLAVKGVIRSISFDANIVIDDAKFVATTPQFVVNRTEWNIKFMSKSAFKNLKDKFIDDEMGLKINLTASI